MPRTLPFRHTVVALLLATAGCDRTESTTDVPVADRLAAARTPNVLLVEAAYSKFVQPHPAPTRVQDPELAAILDALSKEDPVRAESLAARFLKKSPGNPVATYYRALSNHTRKLYAAARPDFENVLAAGPAFERAEGAFLYYAWCCYYLGDLDASEAGFQAVARLGIDPPDAEYGLGLIATERGDLDAAEARMRASRRLAEERIAKKGPKATTSDRTDFAKTEVRIAGILLQRSEIDPSGAAAWLAEARTLLEDAVTIVTQNEEAWFNLSRVYARLGETELETKALDRIHKGRASLSPLDSGGGTGGDSGDATNRRAAATPPNAKTDQPDEMAPRKDGSR